MDKMITIIPVFRRIDAVYVMDDGSLWRVPVPCLGLMEPRTEDINPPGVSIRSVEEFRFVIPIAWTNGDKFFDDTIMEDKNFLGLELDGIQLDWTEEIKEYKDKRKKI